jgi:hypothetical protein
MQRERDTSTKNSAAISRQVSPASLPGVSAGCCQRALVGELFKFLFKRYSVEIRNVVSVSAVYKAPNLKR